VESPARGDGRFLLRLNQKVIRKAVAAFHSGIHEIRDLDDALWLTAQVLRVGIGGFLAVRHKKGDEADNGKTDRGAKMKNAHE
jgi:hypothetical protein